jgi:hypothetical protein
MFISDRYETILNSGENVQCSSTPVPNLIEIRSIDSKMKSADRRSEGKSPLRARRNENDVHAFVTYCKVPAEISWMNTGK